jgi:poly-gamma-glutamate synthesis protein (capsule biosynthesis protein)
VPGRTSAFRSSALSGAALAFLLAASAAPGSAQEVTFLAGGDIEWSRIVRGTTAFSLPSTTEVEMEVAGETTLMRWISLPLLNVPENRDRIRELLGREQLESPTAHPQIAIQYDLSFENVEDDVRHPLQRIRDVVQSADLAFANLEMPLSARARPTGAFAGRPEFADALAWAGFDVVATANNHSFDAEEIGLLDTIEHLDSAGVGHVGTGRDLEDARRPFVVERDGVRFAFLGYAAAVNVGGSFAGPSRSGVVPLDPSLVEEDIRRVRDQVDHVVVSFHWNIENTKQTHPAARDFAHAVIDAGADVVLGHHPHKPQGVEVYRGKVIFYSLGNVIFGHGHDYWGDGFIARLTLDKARIRQVEILPLAGTGTDLAQPYLLTGDRAQALLAEMRDLSALLDTPLTIQGDVGLIRLPAGPVGEGGR